MERYQTKTKSDSSTAARDAVAVAAGDEDDKMEKFFALIRSFRDARDRRINELADQMALKKRRLSEDDRCDVQRQSSSTTASCWIPHFEWQDFKMADESKFVTRHRQQRRLFSKDQIVEEEEEEETKGLDLNLSL